MDSPRVDLPHKFTPAGLDDLVAADSMKAGCADGVAFSSGVGSGAASSANLHEALILNPMQKWARTGRVPGKVVLHIVLMIVYTCWVLALVDQDVHHISHALRRFYTVFMGTSGTFGERVVKLSTGAEFDTAMHRLQRAYFSGSTKDFHSLRPEHITFVLRKQDDSKTTMNLTDISADDMPQVFKKAGLNFEELGDVKFRDFYADVPLKDFPRRAETKVCYLWDLHFVLRSVHSGQVDMTLSYHIHTCKGYYYRHWHLCLVAGLIAAASLFMEVRSFQLWRRALRRLAAARRRRCHQRRRQDAAVAANGGVGAGTAELSLPLVDGTESDETGAIVVADMAGPDFDWWRVVAFGSNVVQIVAVYCACFIDEVNVYMRLNLVAFSAALAWFNLVRYLAFCNQSYTLYKTLAAGLPQVMKFMVGVIPLFMAYAIIGLGLWGFDTEWFSTFSMSIASLFSIMNGDIVHDSYLNLKDTNWPLAQVYLYTFLSLFIYVVLNIFISIVEESYFSNRLRPLLEPSGLSAVPGAKAGGPGGAGDELNEELDFARLVTQEGLVGAKEVASSSSRNTPAGAFASSGAGGAAQSRQQQQRRHCRRASARETLSEVRAQMSSLKQVVDKLEAALLEEESDEVDEA